MSLYPYDPEGLLPSNKVTGTVSINTFPNKFNVMVPKEAPFFRTNFKLKRNNVTLIEGLDYYLVYYYKAAADAVQRPVFGGILPIGDWDTADYEFQTLGGDHLVPQTEVGRYLNREDIKDPRSVDWSDLQRYPVHVEPIDPPNDFEEAVLQDPVIAALVKIKEALSLAAPERDELFERLFNEIAITEEYYNTNLLEIHVHGEHDHKYTAESVGALRKEATAVDALKAYGYTLAQFVDTAKEHGISITQINELIDNTMGLMWGSIDGTENGTITISTYGGNVEKRPKIDLTGSNISLEAGDKDVQVTGSEGGWLGSGLNAIVLPKITEAGVRPVLNGYYILAPTDVPRYLTAANVANLKATVVSTPTVSLFGNGTPSSPIYGRVNPVNAAPGRDGLSTLTNEWGRNLPAVVTQKLMTDTINSLSGFALKTVRINNLSFEIRDNVEVTPAMLGLGNVQNTSANEKPVHAKLGTALQAKALAEHGHTIADVEGSLLATDEKAGLGRIGTNGFALEATVAEFLDGTEEDIDLLENALPAWASSGLYYGDGSYLPAPVYGSYVPVGYSSVGTAGEFEDGRFVFLLPSADFFGRGVFYCYGEIDRSNTIRSLVSTTKPYEPAFLGDATAFDVRDGKGGVFFVRDSNEDEWLVRTFGTMDETRHIASKITSVMGEFVHRTATSWRAVLIGEIVLLIRQIDTNDITYAFYYVDVADIGVVDVLTPKEFRVSYSNIYGSVFNNTNYFSYGKTGYSESLDDEPLVHVLPNDFTSPSLVTSRVHWVVHPLEDTVIVYNYSNPMYTADSTRPREGDFSYKFYIDLVKKEVKIDHPELYPVVFGPNGWEVDAFNQGSSPALGLGGYGSATYHFDGGNVGIVFVHGANAINVRSYRYTDVDPDKLLSITERPPAVSTGHSLNFTVRPSTVAVHFMRRFFLLNRETIIYQDRSSGTVRFKFDRDNPYPGYLGYGPTTERNIIATNESIYFIPRDGIKQEHRGIISIANNEVFSDEVCSAFMSEAGVLSDSRTVRRSDFKAFLDSVRGANLDHRYPSYVVNGTDLYLYILGNPDTPQKVLLLGVYLVTANGNDSAVFVWYELNSVDKYDNVIGFKPESWTSAVRFSNVVYTSVTRGSETAMLQTVYTTQPDDFRIYVGTVYGYRRPGSTTRYTFRISHDGSIWRITTNSSHTLRIESLYCYFEDLGWGRVFNTESRDTLLFRRFVNDTPAGFIGTTVGSDDTILASTRPPEGWVVYITQEYPFYAEGKIYTLPIAEFDLKAMFPANYQNRTFHIHVRSDGTKAWYTIDVNKLADTASRLNVGYVTTDNERIIDLSVSSTRRFGNVGALVRHEANRYAHDSSPEALVQNSQYSELKNMSTVDGFTLPTFRDIFNSWYRFSHATWTNSQTGTETVIGRYPANHGELNAWRYLEQEDTVECTVNSGTYIGFISNDFVGDYVFNTVVTSNDADNDAVTIILAAFRQGDIDNREHTLSLSIDQTLNEEHHRPGSNIRLFDNYGQSDMRTVRTLNPNRFNRIWRDSYAHVYARRTGNKLYIAVENQVIPTQYLNPRDIESLVREKGRLAEEELMASPSYFTAVVDLNLEAPKYARAVRYGYGAFSQPAVRYWNIRRPGADLSNFYGTEETLRLSMRRDPLTYRLIHGKIAPFSSTSEDMEAGVVQNHSRFDNYGDKFWPTAQPSGYSSLGGLRGIAPGYQYYRDGRDGTDRWFLAKVRFSLPNDGQLSIRSFADDVGRFWLASDVGVSGISPDYNHVEGTTVNVAGEKGNYSMMFLIAEHIGNLTPTRFAFEVKLDDVVICSSNDDTTKAITLPNGLSATQPTFPDRNKYTVPSAIRIPYERPEGTEISVSVNRHYGDKRAQIDANADFTPINLEMTEHGMNGAVIETTSQNGRLVDNIYIHQPHNAADSSDITYQIRVTKI